MDVKLNKLDFEYWLMDEYYLTYEEFSKLNNHEKSEIKKAYDEYIRS